MSKNILIKFEFSVFVYEIELPMSQLCILGNSNINFFRGGRSSKWQPVPSTTSTKSVSTTTVLWTESTARNGFESLSTTKSI